MRKLQEKSSFLKKKDAKQGTVQQAVESPTAEQQQQYGSLYRPTPIPNDTSSMSRGVSSQSSLASVGEEPATTSADEGSDVHLTSAPSLHRPTPMPSPSTASGDRSRRNSQAAGLPPLVEDGGMEAEVTPGVPLLVTTRSIEGRTRSPSPDLRRVSPKAYEDHFPEDVTILPHGSHGPPRHTNSLSAIRETDDAEDTNKGEPMEG